MTQSRPVKKEEGCGVWSARNLDRVSGNEPRILLQPGRAEGGGGGGGGGGRGGRLEAALKRGRGKGAGFIGIWQAN